MGSPPKPWERNGVTAPQTPPTLVSLQIATQSAIPERPASFNAPSTSLSTAVSPYGASAYGASPYSRLGGGLGGAYGGYGGLGGLGSYGSYGGYGGGGYGGTMGYGGGYGMSPYSSMGMGMSPYGMGMGAMGMGMNGAGMPLDANGMPIPRSHRPSSLRPSTPSLSSTPSTFMATHSSFFAMVGVIDQFGHLRNALGSGEFREFINGRPVHGPHPQTPQGPKPSKKPLIIFLLAIFGIPYAMTKLVQILNERARNNPGVALPGQPLPR
ncbi:hypothetical protein B0H13DRAFT_2065163 [Mycena leptocephala]|nr:hypothetical protein B0H13DRAFT_2065163 [Mycena leptocephala]